jgi:hypothetical protein
MSDVTPRHTGAMTRRAALPLTAVARRPIARRPMARRPMARRPIARRLALPLIALVVLSACSGDSAATPAELPADVRRAADVQATVAPDREPASTDRPSDPTDEASAGDAAHVDHDAHHGERAEGDPAGARAGDRALPTGEELIAATRADAARWADVTDAEAAGYRSIGDAFTGYEHLVHPEHQADETILDPTRPESLVYRVENGERTYVSAMYLLPPGATMADVPDIDERAVWHLHDDLCFDDEGRLAGVFRDGTCLFGGEHRVTAPMLHVWVVDHPCGPFAGIEGHGETCAAHDH